MIKQLLRANAEEIATLLSSRKWALQAALLTLVGSGIYGCTVGMWRSPLQSLFTAIKFPVLIFLTCTGNALLNGILAQLLGSTLTFRQTSAAILSSFAASALILSALSPIALFILFNAPELGAQNAITGHSVMLLAHVFFIAYAGVVGNQLLLRLLKRFCTVPVARRVLFGWLAGNFLLGSQIAWVLRPFIGSPGLPVQFLRADPLRGNFYEAVGRALQHLLFN